MIVVSILIGVIISLLAYIYWNQKFSKFAQKVNYFPGPTIIPVIGSIYIAWKGPDKIFSTLRELAIKYSSTYKIWTVHIAMLNVVTAEDAEVLLSSNTHIEKSFIYDFISDWLGKGLLTSTGQKWQQRRKMLTPSFHFSILQKFVEIFGEHSQKLVESLEEECEKSETNIIPIISNSALQIICETAMGTTMNITENKTQNTYCQAIYNVAQAMVERFKRPWLYSSFIYNMSSLGRKQNKLINILHTFVRNVIKEREENFHETDINFNSEDDSMKKKKMAMLDLLLSVKRNQGSIDDEGIREEVDTFMFEGHDTTSVALTFAFMLLANHKEHQDKIVQELKEIFGDSKRPANYDDLQKMSYLELCLKESMRLYPSVPRISRQINEDMRIGNVIAPAGCMVNVHIFDLHRDPKYFPDPEKFNPERFSPENVKGRHPYAYIPFSAGPRNCIGQKFAMLEMKSMASAILRNYVLEPVTLQKDSEFIVDLILRSKHDINVRFRPRV